MGASRKRIYYGGVLLLGVSALVVDRTLLTPGAASAATPPAADAPAPQAAASASPPAAEAPPASVPGLARRVDDLDAWSITNDIFHAEPDEWGLRAPGAPAKPVELKLGAIIDPRAGQGAGAWALINARIRRVGDTVAGYTVETITATSVTLRRGEHTRVLQVARPVGAEAP